MNLVSIYQKKTKIVFKSGHIFKSKKSFTCASEAFYVSPLQENYIGQTGNAFRERMTVNRQPANLVQSTRKIPLSEHICI